jgi:hypothetical protein
MGEPMSFLTLTLENLLVEEISSYYYVSKLKLWTVPKTSIKLVGDAVCVCGDDVAAFRRKYGIILLFKEVFRAMGWQASYKDVVSKRLLIFCEDHVIVKRDKDTWKFLYVDVIKSRLLTSMSREHSENRSSVLGKGRTLRNQLDYFESKELKIACLSYFTRILTRDYVYFRQGVKHNSILECKYPLYLPPSCGGLGIPIPTSVLPRWIWPFIGHVYRILAIEDFHKAYVELEMLSSLNSRVKHGISSRNKRNTLYQEVSRFRWSLTDDKIEANSIYSDDFVRTLLEEHGVEVPVDPYTNRFDWSSFKNEASRIGFIPFSEISEQVERILNFQEFLTELKVREPRTFNRWLKDSRNYWKTRITSRNRAELATLGRQKFVDFKTLESLIQRKFSGWVWIGPDRHNRSLINSGPSMRVTFSKVPLESRVHPVRYGVPSRLGEKMAEFIC